MGPRLSGIWIERMEQLNPPSVFVQASCGSAEVNFTPPIHDAETLNALAGLHGQLKPSLKVSAYFCMKISTLKNTFCTKSEISSFCVL